MPERTRDGKWKWGNIKRNSRKELSQTVYGIWKGTGSKGSFSKFYHEGNPYGAKHRADHKKHMKECYQLNPLLEGKEVDMILGTITSEREKAFLVAAKKIAKDFTIIKNIYRDDNCIYVNLNSTYSDENGQVNDLHKALITLTKGFHFGKPVYYPIRKPEDKIAFFAMVSCPEDNNGNDIYQKVTESVDFFKRSLFSKADVTIEELSSIIRRLHIDKDNPIHKPQYQRLLNKKYWQLRELKVRMRRKGITKVPLDVIEGIAGSN